MTQILITLNEGTSPQSIRRAIGLLRGVETTTLLKSKADSNSKTLAQQKFVKESLSRAFSELKEAQRTGKKLQSADDFLNELEMEEAI